MARIVFRVAEVNDMSLDGPMHKRVVLEAKTGAWDRTGAVPEHDFQPGAFRTGRLELVVRNETQLTHFAVGSLHEVQIATVPEPETKAEKADREEAEAKKAKADAKQEKADEKADERQEKADERQERADEKAARERR